MSVVLALMLMQSASAPPLQPSSKWAVEYEESMCVLSRSYGSGDAQRRIGFKPVTFGDFADIVIVVDDGAAGYRLGKGRVVLRPGGATVEGRVRSWKVQGKPKRVIALEVPRTALTQIAAAAELTITADNVDVTVAQTGGSKAFAALETCEADLAAQFQPNTGADGQSGAIKAGTDALAKGNAALWHMDADYPAEAIQLRLEGSTSARAMIGTDGHVKKCLITGRSDHPALDAIVCEAWVARGRYSPALDGHGKPIETIHSRRVRWVLPK